MKKIILMLLVAMLVLVGCDDSPCRSRKKSSRTDIVDSASTGAKILSHINFRRYGNAYVTCLDGYKFIVTMSRGGSSAEQVYQEGESPSHPAKPVRCY